MTDEKDLKLVEKIKSEYSAKGEVQSQLDELKALDKKVKTPANIFAYTYGIIGTLVLGFGMCLAMKVIGDLMALGIVIGVVGIAMVCTTYPIFSKIRLPAFFAEQALPSPTITPFSSSAWSIVSPLTQEKSKTSIYGDPPKSKILTPSQFSSVSLKTSLR